MTQTARQRAALLIYLDTLAELVPQAVQLTHGYALEVQVRRLVTTLSQSFVVVLEEQVLVLAVALHANVAVIRPSHLLVEYLEQASLTLHCVPQIGGVLPHVNQKLAVEINLAGAVAPLSLDKSTLDDVEKVKHILRCP